MLKGRFFNFKKHQKKYFRGGGGTSEVPSERKITDDGDWV